VSAEVPHDGPLVLGGHKLTNRLVHALAADAARTAGVREALLFDRDGYLVEGAGSNVVAVTVDGALVTPPLSRGAVAGIAREVLVERVPDLAERDLRREDLFEARAVLCTNAVRGARPLSELDRKPLPGADHPWVARLNEALEAA
jgi:branched-subunit amino acid aminotransferase/4-amino-4-deoxychorismate lyase